MEDIRKNIVNNLVLLRKAHKMTQQELGKALNYSDKAISRWEVGDSLPDISVLIRICEIYGVEFEWLIHRHDEAPKGGKKTGGHGIRIAIACLLATLCFAVATIIFIYNRIFKSGSVWIAFVWAVPVSLLLAVFLSYRWWNGTTTTVLLSLGMWSLLTAVYLHFLLTFGNIWPLFLLGVPMQIIFILFRYIQKRSTRP